MIERKIMNTWCHLDGQPQLLVDNVLVESTHGVTRRWHHPQRHGNVPLLYKDKPWENRPFIGLANYTVLKDPEDGLIKCWYEDLPHPEDKPRLSRVLYAESEDGITFRKPELDICSVNGQPTNLIMGHISGTNVSNTNPWSWAGVHSNGIVIDPHPARSEDRFRTIFVRSVPKDASEAKLRNSVSSYGADFKLSHSTECAHSSDGIHWKPYDSTPLFGSSPGGLGDVTILSYDEDGRMFVLNTRHGLGGLKPLPPRTPDMNSSYFRPYFPNRPDLANKRTVFQLRSSDMLHWTEPQVVSVPDDSFDNLDDGHYGMQQFRVGAHHFALLGIFPYVDNEMEVRLLHSRDGIHFAPTDRGRPFLAPRGEGHWDAYQVSSCPPIEMGDEWWFYHGGSAGHHDLKLEGEDDSFALGLARLRKEGLASLDASPHREGYFITTPICCQYRRPQARSLVINAKCRPSGYVRVALLDLENRPVKGHAIEDCDTFTDDSTEHTVRWHGDADCPLATGWYKFHFLMKNSEVFSFRME